MVWLIYLCCLRNFWYLCSGICEVLHETATCPKCFSTKCRVEDLLPNVSLRQAIEHFLQSQILTTGLGSDYQRYAPGRKFIQKILHTRATLQCLTS